MPNLMVALPTPCVEVWQTANLRRLRLGEEKKRTRMWANAQRDGRPAEYLCSTPQSLADAHYWSAVQ